MKKRNVDNLWITMCKMWITMRSKNGARKIAFWCLGILLFLYWVREVVEIIRNIFEKSP